VDGRFVSPAHARRQPLSVAASNWAATAREVARHHPDALLVDIGTTTTDIVPIRGGHVVARGRTDPERLAAGELVYMGAVRTPAEAIASRVPLGATTAGVSAEGFAVAGDVYVWRGELATEDYGGPTPDGRPADRAFAGERLARVVCADREMLDDAAVSAIADALARAQRARIAESLLRVRSRHPSLHMAVVTGLGAFLAAAAAREAGLEVVYLSAHLGDAAARCAPAASVALLLERDLRHGPAPRPADPVSQAPPGAPGGAVGDGMRTREGAAGVSVVVKVGGSLLAHPRAFEPVVAALDAMQGTSLLVVPGGGPFADAVRDADRRFEPGDTAAHWMAVLAMDQYAHLLVSRLRYGALVTDAREVASALDAGRVPVLAPYRWLRAVDPLPHTWDVTSDSIAAWVGRALHARHLLLVKAPGVTGPASVDPYCFRLADSDLAVTIVPADDDALRTRMAEMAGAPGRGGPAAFVGGPPPE
jgi:probable H4MPT-linked C1 transfer pathway protein